MKTVVFDTGIIQKTDGKDWTSGFRMLIYKACVASQEKAKNVFLQLGTTAAVRTVHLLQ